jgi:hypothetical protein
MTGTPKVSSSEWDGTTQSYDKEPMHGNEACPEKGNAGWDPFWEVWGCGGIHVARVC